MINDPWESVWEYIRAGKHAIVLGSSALPPGPSDLKVVRVSCEATGPSGGALDAARRKVLQFLGEDCGPLGRRPISSKQGFAVGFWVTCQAHPWKPRWWTCAISSPSARVGERR